MNYSDYSSFLQYAYMIALLLSVYGLYSYLWYMYGSDKKGTTNYENLSNLALDDNIDSKTINTSRKNLKSNK